MWRYKITVTTVTNRHARECRGNGCFSKSACICDGGRIPRHKYYGVTNGVAFCKTRLFEPSYRKHTAVTLINQS
ncbi:MAG: hypothetical protein IJB68_02025 [Ruminococcus sp.]|nr:hypothetical protein [Ruminococcus sp.]